MKERALAIVVCYISLTLPYLNKQLAETSTPKNNIVIVVVEVLSQTAKYSVNQAGKKNEKGK
ncbi:hypothetical protein [Glaciecola sp. 33A]|uniref:hypothetical protein n=1 Tax=Glaciecola sp. 33A TaxID=2057807 RepID=UPI0012FF14DF|nr:hypothetical protein [Glaciecola sp. 33A]